MERPFSELSKLEIVEAIENNLFELWSRMVSFPWIESSQEPDMLRYVSGVPFPLCNGILGARFSEPSIDGRIEAALTPFKDRNLPMFWYVGPSSRPASLGEHLKGQGLTLVDNVPGMAADLSQLGEQRSHPAEWTIRTVEGREILKEWIHVFSLVYGVPEIAADFFFKIMDQIGYGPSLPFKHYLGYWNGKAVACASLFLGAGAAGLYNVATVPEVRGKGLGTAISARTLKEGYLRGYRTGILHSTSMGLPVYQRLGFKEHCRIQIYLRS